MVAELIDKSEGLKALDWVDKIVMADPVGSQVVQDANMRWFRLKDCHQTHTTSGVSTTPTLQGLEACSYDIILQIDVDLMLVGRAYEQQSNLRQFISTHASHSFSNSISTQHASAGTLQLMVSALIEDRSAISISLPSLPVTAAQATGANIFAAGDNAVTSEGQSFTATYMYAVNGKPWRTEVRGCLLHRQRLKHLLPLLTASEVHGTLHPSAWYRALDAAVESSGGSLHTYRAHVVQVKSPYGSLATTLRPALGRSTEHSRSKVCLGTQPDLAFLHPPNQPVKESSWCYSAVRSALRSECWPKEQPGKVDVLHNTSTCSSEGTSVHDTSASSAVKPNSEIVPGDPCCNVSFMSSVAELWALPHRCESLVVVVCGRNVAPGRFQRCLESLLVQDWQEWGLVLVDDCSPNASCVAYQEALLQYGIPQTMLSRVTHLCWNGSRRGMLFNDVVAIRHVCTDPGSVIVTLDADDMLLRHDALRSIMSLHSQGHDFVVGGHVRTDKETVGPGYNTGSGCVTFGGPSRQRLLRGGGNVWQHCRSFRKRLFDAIPDDRLRMHKQPSVQNATAAATQLGPSACSATGLNLGSVVDGQDGPKAACGPGDIGYYYELANDWAFTMPMAELAEAPAVLGKAVYLYEPFWPRNDRLLREGVIGTIMAQPPAMKTGSDRRKIVAVIGDSSLDTARMTAHRVTGDERRKEQLAEQVGRLLVDRGYHVMTGGLGGVMSAAFKGAKSSLNYHEGDTLAVIPGDDPTTANGYADVVISTGLGH